MSTEVKESAPVAESKEIRPSADTDVEHASISSTSAQEGVTKVEALAQAWGKSGLIVAYFG